jgi:hypothetical protein
MKCDILLSYTSDLPYSIVSDFIEEANGAGINVIAEKRESGPHAGIEWMLPTAVAVYLVKPYFEEILKEAAKDHYSILKKCLLKIIRNLFGEKPERRQEKVSDIFSVMSQTSDGIQIKFLFVEGVSAEVCEETIENIFRILREHYANAPNDGLSEKIGQLTQKSPHTIYLMYDEENKDHKILDPIKEAQKDSEHKNV